MKRLLMLMFAGTVMASPSAAQSGPVAQQSSDQLVCQLSGDCDTVGTPEATQDKGRSRGFSIVKPGQARPTVATQPPARVTTATPTTSRTRSSSNGARSGLSSSRFAVAQPVGRADLMITFITGSANLTGQARTNADQFVGALSSPRLNGMRFAIEGHTDAVGSRAYNVDLSQRRAQAVVDYLASKGASRTRFDIQGYGFDRPLNSRNPGAAANRRVEVVKVN